LIPAARDAARWKEEAMDDKASGKRVKLRRGWIAAAALFGSGLVGGAVLAGTHVAGAQTPTDAPSATAPAAMGHGPDETLLTDGTADKVREAALEAVPGGTIIRVETDSEGSPYEAHVRKADGSIVTVKVDENYKVTSTESGFGGGPGGGRGTSTDSTTA
jgi:hypothetical protein